MESRFAHLRQRDTSVSMLRVKMSRRRSQSQKENRERTVNTRRQLEMLQELEVSSLDASIAMANMSTIQEKTLNSTKLAKSKTPVLSREISDLTGNHLLREIFSDYQITLPFLCLLFKKNVCLIPLLFSCRRSNRGENETA